MTIDELNKRSKFLFFEITELKPKTKVIAVLNKAHKYSLGDIKWNCAWRRYCFYPESEMVFDMGCMEEIIKCIKILKKGGENGQKN